MTRRYGSFTAKGTCHEIRIRDRGASYRQSTWRTPHVMGWDGE
ncbi:hypothetical protein OG883_06560 [Streptomyces sp. NBC_01142]|nr:hypothetical protein [Streptomyces sp. NBC_01142]MCX4819575.1 hypothetical protein [Streptomyces sp. NBC_01142]